MDDRYNWGHFGRCNCGFLAKEVTRKTSKEIHEAALEKKGEDWGVRVDNFCPVSGFLIDDIISDLFSVGLSPKDIVSIEKLNDPLVLQFIPKEREPLRKGNRKDAITYMKAFRKYISEELEKLSLKI
jgi:hypothetical protein